MNKYLVIFLSLSVLCSINASTEVEKQYQSPLMSEYQSLLTKDKLVLKL